MTAAAHVVGVRFLDSSNEMGGDSGVAGVVVHAGEPVEGTDDFGLTSIPASPRAPVAWFAS